jgi:hypothetical protein
MSGKLSDLPEEEQDDVVQQITDAFYESEGLAQVIHDWVMKNQPNPMAIVFAALVIDKGLKQQVTDWEELRQFAITSWNDMDKKGILGELRALKE